MVVTDLIVVFLVQAALFAAHVFTVSAAVAGLLVLTKRLFFDKK